MGAVRLPRAMAAPPRDPAWEPWVAATAATQKKHEMAAAIAAAQNIPITDFSML